MVWLTVVVLALLEPSWGWTVVVMTVFANGSAISALLWREAYKQSKRKRKTRMDVWG